MPILFGPECPLAVDISCANYMGFYGGCRFVLGTSQIGMVGYSILHNYHSASSRNLRASYTQKEVCKVRELG